MDEQTEQTLRSLVGHTIVRVEIRNGDLVELGVPDSEGWHVTVSPRIAEDQLPELRARWEPGLPRHLRLARLRGLVRRVAHPLSR